MIFVTRTKAPARLDTNTEGTAGHTELTNARMHFYDTEKSLSDMKFAVYGHPEVRTLVHETFDKKCVYCEKKIELKRETNIEHYRPKGSIHDCPEHPGYWWLAMQWDNLLLSCGNCNSLTKQPIIEQHMDEVEIARALTQTRFQPAGKQCFFPTEDNVWVLKEQHDVHSEKPLIIDPTRFDPEPYIQMLEVGGHLLIVPLDRHPRIEATVRILGLNRSDVAQYRMVVALDMMSRIDRLVTVMARETQTARERQQADEEIEYLIQDLHKHTLSDRAFAGTARFMVRQLEAGLA